MTDLLIVSKNPKALASLIAFFRNEGYDCQEASTLGEAAAALAGAVPRMILCTYDGGQEEVELLFETAQDTRCAICLIAPAEHRVHAIRLYQEGAHGYVLEPVSPIELRTLINRGLSPTTRAAKRFTFDLLSTLRQAVIVLNKQRRILFANPRAVKLFRQSATKLRGSSITALDSRSLYNLTERSESEPAQVYKSVLIVGPEQLAVAAQCAAVFDGQQEIAGYSLILEDETEDQQVAVNLRLMNEATSLVAREYLSPHLYEETDQNPNSGPELRQRLKRFQLIIDCLSELGRPVIVEPIPLLLSELVELAEVRARAYCADPCPVSFHFEDATLRISCRRRLFEYILLNLVLSAQQSSTRNGKIRIRTYEQGNQISVTLSDNGAPVYSVGLFDLSLETSERGQGLALFLAHRLATHHKAELTARDGSSNLTLQLGSSFRASD